MPIRTCRASCRDSRGIEHVIEVSAQSLYEAVAQALGIFRNEDWCEDSGPGPTSITVTVKQPEVQHKVRIKDFEDWLDSTARSPADMVLKSRLRDIIGR
jgi:hypothetical protein